LGLLWVYESKQEKSDQLRAMGYNVRPGQRPSQGTEGLYVNDVYFDEQFVDALIAGDSFEEVNRRKQIWEKEPAVRSIAGRAPKVKPCAQFRFIARPWLLRFPRKTNPSQAGALQPRGGQGASAGVEPQGRPVQRSVRS
jgi:hypothetical protein